MVGLAVSEGVLTLIEWEWCQLLRQALRDAELLDPLQDEIAQDRFLRLPALPTWAKAITFTLQSSSASIVNGAISSIYEVKALAVVRSAWYSCAGCGLDRASVWFRFGVAFAARRNFLSC